MDIYVFRAVLLKKIKLYNMDYAFAFMLLHLGLVIYVYGSLDL